MNLNDKIIEILDNKKIRFEVTTKRFGSFDMWQKRTEFNIDLETENYHNYSLNIINYVYKLEEFKDEYDKFIISITINNSYNGHKMLLGKGDNIKVPFEKVKTLLENIENNKAFFDKIVDLHRQNESDFKKDAFDFIDKM